MALVQMAVTGVSTLTLVAVSMVSPMAGQAATQKLPEPTKYVVGPLSPPSVSKTLATVQGVYETMTKTVYSHKYTEDVLTGYYAWDCVGMTDWVLKESAPKAWEDMHKSLKIRPGYVPSPTKWYDYFAGKQGKLSKNWQRVTNINKLKPGSYLVFPKHRKTRFVGHAVIAAGQPIKLSDGSYALLVMDSTGSPHGPYDSRLTDKRAVVPAGKKSGSGLGMGTMRIMANKNGKLTGARWSVNAGGPAMRDIPIAAAIAKK